MNLSQDVVICWTPSAWGVVNCRWAATSGRVAVGLNVGGFVDPWALWMPATCLPGVRDLTPEALPYARLAAVLLNMQAMIIRDGMDPQEVHRALLSIQEYRQSISPDQAGAE